MLIPHPRPPLPLGLVAGYRDSGTRLIAVDYTHPTAVNPNGVLYARHKMDFVMVGCHLCASPIHLAIILPFDSLPRYPLLPGPISLFLPPLFRVRRARRVGIERSF